MKRRTALTGASVALSNLIAGCLDGRFARSASAGSETYEECSSQYIIPINSLPESAENEVETALRTGLYESDKPLMLDNVMDTGNSYLSGVEERFKYYEPVIETVDERYTLQLKETYPETESDIGLAIENDTDEQRTITVRLVAGDEMFFTDVFNTKPGEMTDLSRRGVDYRYGVIDVQVETEVLSAETTWEVDEFGRGYVLRVNDERISIGRPEDLLDRVRCEWDRSGDLKPRG